MQSDIAKRISPGAGPTGPAGELYADLARAVRGLTAGEDDGIANLANFAALVYGTLPDLNWAGFYLLRGTELVLGPFQGKPACVRIAIGRGVCGTAAERRAAVIVADVHEFAGHIACDPASRSELVVPMFKDGALVGVFDLDSPRPGRFDAQDQRGIEQALQILADGTRLPAPAVRDQLTL